MNPNKLLTFVMPTNEPDVFEKFFMNGLDNFLEMRDYCTFAINFQKPWTDDHIDDVVSRIEEKGFNVVHSFNSYEFTPPYVPINKIRIS